MILILLVGFLGKVLGATCPAGQKQYIYNFSPCIDEEEQWQGSQIKNFGTCGSNTVTSASKCQTLASSHGKTYHNEISSTDYPTGCAVDSAGAYYNSAQTSVECSTITSCICNGDVAEDTPMCAAGKYQNNALECVACPNGQYSETGKSTCEICPSGQKPNYDKTECQPDDDQLQGYYYKTTGTCGKPITTAEKCLEAAQYLGVPLTQTPPTYFWSTRASGCIHRYDGTTVFNARSSASECIETSNGYTYQCICGSTNSVPLCAAGKYQNNALECVACPNGQYSEPGKSTCDNCPSGQVPYYDKTDCQPDCPSGQKPTYDNTDCQPDDDQLQGYSVPLCAAGKYQNNALECVACPNGQYSETGKSTCEICPSGQKPNYDKTECQPDDDQLQGYYYKTTGTCGKPITTAEKCLEAAQYLGVPLTQTPPTVSWSDQPSGCIHRYYDGTTVFNTWYSTNECEEISNGFTHRCMCGSTNSVPLCAVGEYQNNALECAACASDKVSERGKTQCEFCPAGKYKNNGTLYTELHESGGFQCEEGGLITDEVTCLEAVQHFDPSKAKLDMIGYDNDKPTGCHRTSTGFAYFNRDTTTIPCWGRICICKLIICLECPHGKWSEAGSSALSDCVDIPAAGCVSNDTASLKSAYSKLQC